MKRKWLGLVLFVIGVISFGCGQKQANERIQATDQQGVYTVQLQEKEGFVVTILIVFSVYHSNNNFKIIQEKIYSERK